MNPWLVHVSEFRRKHPGKSYKECLRLASKTYKKSKKGGNLTGDVIRGSVAGIREGMTAVPFGNVVMEVINPQLNKNLNQLEDWESGIPPVMKKSRKQRLAEYHKKFGRYKIERRYDVRSGQFYDKRVPY